MIALDPLRIPLRGLALIEASAGTGKTYTITSLYVRLILERRRRWIAVRLAILERLGRKRRARELRAQLRFLKHAHILGRAYAPYTTRQFRFQTNALDTLAAGLTPEDRELFPMDPRRVAWTEYLSNVHVPAVRREAGGQPPSQHASAGDARTHGP